MILKGFIFCLCTIAALQLTAAAFAEDAPKPAESPNPTETPKPAEAPEAVVVPKPADAIEPVVVPKPVEAPKPPPRPNVNVDILDYSWKSGFVWVNFNKTECTWSAKIKNNNPEPRHICLNYEFLDEDSLPVFQNGKCEVVLGNSEGIISGSIIVKSLLVQDVKKSNVIALEAHKLHSFVRPPAVP